MKFGNTTFPGNSCARRYSQNVSKVFVYWTGLLAYLFKTFFGRAKALFPQNPNDRLIYENGFVSMFTSVIGENWIGTARSSWNWIKPKSLNKIVVVYCTCTMQTNVNWQGNFWPFHKGQSTRYTLRKSKNYMTKQQFQNCQLTAFGNLVQGFQLSSSLWNI